MEQDQRQRKEEQLRRVSDEREHLQLEQSFPKMSAFNFTQFLLEVGMHCPSMVSNQSKTSNTSRMSSCMSFSQHPGVDLA